MSVSVECCKICKLQVDDENLVVELREKGSKGVNEASKARGDDISTQPGDKVHKECRRLYCNSQQIEKAQKASERLIASSPSLRSGKTNFQFTTHCLFCGQAAKSENRKGGCDIFPVRTLEFGQVIEQICDKRNDEWAGQVKHRLKSVHDLPAADALYHQTCSVNFRTGKQLPKTFQTENVTPNKKSCGRPLNVDQSTAFIHIAQYLQENDDEQITVTDLVNKMKECCGDLAYSQIYMKKKLQEHFGSSIIITEINGKHNVVTFRNTAASILQNFYTRPKTEDPSTEKMAIIKTAANLLLSDIKSMNAPKKNYPEPSKLMSQEDNVAYIPESLYLLLRSLFSETNAEIKIASIGQAIIQAARPRVLIAPLQIGLAIQMHHQFASKFLIDTLSKLGFSSSYTEVQRFEVSAAAWQGNSIPALAQGQFAQFVADNVDHNIRTLDGHNTFHGMGIIGCITPGTSNSVTVPRTAATIQDLAEIGNISIQFYQQEHNFMASINFEILPTFDGHDSTEHVDLLSKIIWPLKAPRPGWSGIMQMVQKGTYPGKSTVCFLPMIDLNPGDMSCIYSTLLYVCYQAKRQNTKPVLTFDQPLYWKALTIITNESQNSDLKLIVLRLGGFHIEMSYLGCIGRLMEGSGLNELLEVVYASNTVCHMLTGKAVSRALRGHFLVDDSLNAMLLARLFDIQLPSLLQETEQSSTDNKTDLSSEELPEVTHSDESTSVQVEDRTASVTDKPNTVNEKLMLDDTLKEAGDLYEKLMRGEMDVETVCEHPVFEILEKSLLNEKRALLKYRTAKLWLQYMTMIDLLRKFLKAERTGNWQLHLQSVKEMLPYFAAAGHNLYVKSAYMYLQMMGKLEHEHPDIYQLFNDGYHVIRRSDRYWAGLSSDLIIEQVLMKSIKSTGGLTRGHGMSESQRTQWLLSMPACTDINNSMQKFTTVDYHTSDQHVESGLSRKERDQKDRLKFLSFLQERSPFVEEVSLRNIETGVEGDPSVNVDIAKEVGDRVIESMVGKAVLEYSFKKSEQAVTLNAKNSFKIGGEAIHVDPQLLFQRLIAAADRLVENQAEIFSYELCSYPASLFEASGLLRQADKPSLASAIWSLGECGTQETLTEPLHYVLDGGSLIQRLLWTRGATFSSICNMYVDYVSRRYQNAIVGFDGYSAGPSTKDCNHLRRTHGLSSAKVMFTGNTPCKSKKEHFLANDENKQSFIYMLSQHLEEKGFQTLHAASDADVQIVKTAVECASVCKIKILKSSFKSREHIQKKGTWAILVMGHTVVIGEDTDLLILLLYHSDVNSNRICFMSGANKSNVKVVKKWDILQTKRLLGENVCSMLPFIHAVTGCDTTSRVFGIGKGMALKKMISDNYLKEQAVKFTGVTSKTEIIQAGEETLLCLYNGAPYEGLDHLRCRKFASKVMTSTTSVQVHSLPPTSAAASYHSMRTYLQVQEWTGNDSNLNPLEWGWKQADNLLLPIQTHLQPAPEDLLKIIRCSCKSNCDSKRCTCRKHGLECSPGCGECQGKSCLNAQTITEMDLIDDI